MDETSGGLGPKCCDDRLKTTSVRRAFGCRGQLPDSVADADFWLQQFERKGNRPLTWRLVADDLLVTATFLLEAWRSVQSKRIPVGKPVAKEWGFLRSVKLLRAAALEALLKGRAVRRGHRFVVNGAFCPIPNTGNGHNLVLLSDETKFRLDPSERDLLARLSPSLELARYPIGKSWQTGLKKDPHPGVGHVIAGHYSSGDERVLARLIKRLRCAVH